MRAQQKFSGFVNLGKIGFQGILLSCIFTACTSSAAVGQPESFSFSEISQPTETQEPLFLTASDGTKLAYYPYIATAPIASLVFLHGGGAYSGGGGYPQLAKELAEDHQVNTILVDIRGHGHSGGPRGDSPSVQQVYQDLDQILTKVKQDHPAQPLFLGGHSSGAGLVLNHSSHSAINTLSGYFFLAPYFGYKSNTQKTDGVNFTQVDVPFFVFNSLTLGWLFGNTPAVHFNYPKTVLAAQPLFISNITVNMSNALTPQNPQQQFKQLPKPFGLFIGDADETFDPDKIVAYGQLPNPTLITHSHTHKVENASHLSVLLKSAPLIGQQIKNVVGTSP